MCNTDYEPFIEIRAGSKIARQSAPAFRRFVIRGHMYRPSVVARGNSSRAQSCDRPARQVARTRERPGAVARDGGAIDAACGAGRTSSTVSPTVSTETIDAPET